MFIRVWLCSIQRWLYWNFFVLTSRRQKFREAKTKKLFTKQRDKEKMKKNVEKAESNGRKAKTNSYLPILEKDNPVPISLRSQN